jgi:hypothetical protein
MPLPQSFWNNEVEGLAKGLVAGIAEYAFRAWVPEAYDAAAVGRDDRVRACRENSFGKYGRNAHDALMDQIRPR